MINRIKEIAPGPGAGPSLDPAVIKKVICAGCLREVYESTRAVLGIYAGIVAEYSDIPDDHKQRIESAAGKVLADFKELVE